MPNYIQHRSGVTATDTLPITNRRRGANIGGYKTALLHVVPSGGANPTVQVLYWSEAASAFVRGHTATAFAGVGADTPFVAPVDVHGQTIFVAVTTLAAGSVDIYVSAGPENV